MTLFRTISFSLKGTEATPPPSCQPIRVCVGKRPPIFSEHPLFRMPFEKEERGAHLLRAQSAVAQCCGSLSRRDFSPETESRLLGRFRWNRKSGKDTHTSGTGNVGHEFFSKRTKVVQEPFRLD